MKVTPLAIGIFVAFLIFAKGWWVPNWTEWEHCGEPGFSAATRGIFGKPSFLECASASINQPPPDAPTPVGPPAVDQYTPYPTEQPAPDCIRVTPADNGPYWIHADGTAC
jgi:hypothetical protein